jgi:transcriptional regulator with GAF, ATPase, and Fis domain
MRKLFELVDRVAAGTISVLLVGETGAGKEVVAAAVHERSPRRKKPYLRLNCSAFAENLLESELFGHEAGAFSGARTAKLGLFETANGGTVLLDEIGEMPLALQAKLLRVVETREVIPIGGTRVRRLDVRFLAATNRDLRERIRSGHFREDLYFRLSGVTIEVPPLRARRSEIAPLARLFAAEAAVALGRSGTPELAPDAAQFLEEQSWPGNVRELRNCVERAVLLSNSNVLSVDDVDPSCERLVPRGTQKGMRIVETLGNDDETGSQSAERTQIQQALARCGGNQTRAAALLGMARRTLVKKLATLGLPRPRR